MAQSSVLDVSGTVADATSPQDLAAIDPTNNIETVMVGFASNDANRTYSGQTIGGVAATERIDEQEVNLASLTVYDRINVNTGTSTFATQATPSGTPSEGTIGLLIFKVAASSIRRLLLMGVGP